MTNWEYVQTLLDTIDRLNRIIKVQATVLEMYEISIDRSEEDHDDNDD